MTLFKKAISNLAHLLFPHVCVNCGSDALNDLQLLCFHCLSELPYTNFALHANNPVEKKFWGRLPVKAAASLFYFNKDSAVQHLLHQLKYQGKKEVGIYLGKMLGEKLVNSNRFMHIDAIIPLPLATKKEMLRGFNQSTIIANGMAEVMNIPVCKNIIIRTKATESQIHKTRIERWENMKDVFSLTNADAIAGKNIILVDDVITTGATAESCGATLLQAKGVSLNIVSVASV
ncbi:MAG: ComF family protein [Bacteroidota bacterium]